MPLTLEEIFDSKRFDEKTLKQPKWLKNGKLAFVDEWPGSEKATVWLFDPVSRLKEPLFDPETLCLPGQDKPLEVRGTVWSDDGKTLLLTGEPIARFKPCGDLFVYDLGENALRRMTETDRPQYHPKFSPDGRQVGVVRANDIFLIDLENGMERALTHDGSETLYNGRCGWVYEEELGLADGWSWSPDGRTIAYLQQDESCVPVTLLPRYDEPHAEPELTRYPKAGEASPVTRLGLLEVASGVTRWVELSAQGGDHYIAAYQWEPDLRPGITGEEPDSDPRDTYNPKLLVQCIARRQNWLQVFRVNSQTGEREWSLIENDDAWVDHEPKLHLLDSVNDESAFRADPSIVWLSDDSGFRHLYLQRIFGSKKQLACGPWDISEVIGIDGDSHVYFAASKELPSERHLFRVSETDTEPVCLTDGTPGWHSGILSEDGQWLLHTHSSVFEPSTTVVRSADGALVETLVSQREDFLEGVDLLPWEFLTFETSDGVTLHARMLKPRDLEPGRRCPAIMHTYGGPGSQVVQNAWGGKSGLWYQMLANEGFVVFMVDNRGTGGRGRDFMKQVFLRLGELETQDQIAGARYLQGLPFVDPERIGIWGWSYGGYVTTLCMLHGADVFKAGVAVAPVTDWALYDSIYTERYMRSPADNPEGYRKGSPVFDAEKLKGKFLVIHGLMDDNVHFQHSARLAAALQDAKKPFETMFYPGKRHGLEDRHYHLYSAMTDFWRRSL
jgi:dipeptidyl-peptidase 4